MNESTKPFIQITIVFLIGAFVITSTAWLVNHFREPEVIERVVEKQIPVSVPECPKNLEVYNELVKEGSFIRLVENERMYAEEGQFVNDKNVSVLRSGEDQIACGYLYIRARKNGSGLEEKYESVYINPHEFGGHILSRRGIGLPPMQDATAILLPLNLISYLPNRPFDPSAQNFKSADWVKLLNVSNELRFHVGLSAADPRAIVEEVTIAYKCWNPTTGAETKNCQLSTTP